MPARQLAHTAEPRVLAEIRPAAHAVQLVAPVAGWNRPAAQNMQVLESAAPVAVEKVPAAQLTHAIDADGWAAYRPTPQLRQLAVPVLGWNRPVLQLWQLARPVTPLKVPGAQLRHTAAETAPVELE